MLLRPSTPILCRARVPWGPWTAKADRLGFTLPAWQHYSHPVLGTGDSRRSQVGVFSELPARIAGRPGGRTCV